MGISTWRRTALVAGALCLLAACSTTNSQSTADGGFTADAAAPDGGAAPASETTAPASVGPTTSIAAPTPTTAGTSNAGGAASVSTATTAVRSALRCGTGQMGKGVTASTITLGIAYSSDIGDANRAVGGNSFKQGEPRSFAEAYIKHFNRTGGLCGRKIVPVWFDTKVVTGSSKDAAEQAACTQLTQDNKVFAVNSLTSGFGANLITCLTRAGVASVDISALLNLDQEQMRVSWPYLFQPFGFTLDRFLPIYVDTLMKASYFAPGARVGVIYTDIPAEERAIQRILIPALKAKGVNVVEQARVTHVYDIDTLARSQSELNTAVLRFQTSRVSHVIAPVDGFSIGLFAQRAEQQNYRPRYATSSSATGRGGIGQNVQWERAVLVAWAPATGFADAMATDGVQRCLAMLKAEGHRLPHDGLSVGQALTTCDFLTFLRSALDRATDLTPAGLSAAAGALGPQGNSMTFGHRLTANRHDGGSILRVATYSGGAKGQWRYVTAPETVG